MKVICHSNLYSFYRRNRDIETFFDQSEAIYEKFGTDGVYIDGLIFDDDKNKVDNKIANWEVVRRFRQLFGSDGVIVYHGTSLGSPVATVPNIDSYCDATIYGEGVVFNSVDDPYVKYQVRKYGISNTVGMWEPDKKGAHISDKEIVDAIIKMNCRDWFKASAFWERIHPTPKYRYYLQRVNSLKNQYYIQTISNGD